LVAVRKNHGDAINLTADGRKIFNTASGDAMESPPPVLPTTLFYRLLRDRKGFLPGSNFPRENFLASPDCP